MPKVSVCSGGHCSDSYRLFNMSNLLSMSPFARGAPWVILLQNRANFFLIPADLFIIHRRDSRGKGIYYIGYFCASPTLIASQEHTAAAFNHASHFWIRLVCQAPLSAAESHIGDLTYLKYQAYHTLFPSDGRRNVLPRRRTVQLFFPFWKLTEFINWSRVAHTNWVLNINM